MAPGSRLPRLTIVGKLAILLVLFAAIVLTALALPAYLSGTATLERDALSELGSVADSETAALATWTDDRQAGVARLARTPQVVAAAERLSTPSDQARAGLRDLLQPWAGQEAEFTTLSVLAPSTAAVLVSTDPLEEGRFHEDTAFFQDGSIGPMVSAPYYSLELEQPAMATAAPIRTASGTLMGVLVGGLRLQDISDIVTNTRGQRNTIDAYLVTRSGLLMTQPRYISGPAVLRRAIHTEAVNRCLAGQSGEVADIDYRGVPTLAVYRWSPRQSCLVVKLDRTEAFAPVASFARALGLVTALVLIAASVVAIIVGRFIARPVRALHAAATAFEQGDLSRRIAGKGGGDELAQLARQFDSMAEAIQSREAELRQRSAALEQAERNSRYQALALERSNTDLQQFAYSASHDLQEPLRAISGFSELLAERYRGSLDERADKYISFVVEGATRMQRLINDLLEYSRIGSQGIEVATVLVAEVLNAAKANLYLAIQDTAATVTATELPAVRADLTQLTRVFQNLIGNALKFRGEASPRIEIAAETREHDWLFSVKDNGIGFDPRHAERIFMMFQRLNSRELYQGTGIGLAACKRIVERHGGTIWAESEPDRGSTFYFTIARHIDQPSSAELSTA